MSNSPLRRITSLHCRLLAGAALIASTGVDAGTSFAAESPAVVCVQSAPERCALPLGAPAEGVLSEPHHIHDWVVALPATATLRVTLSGLAVDFDVHVYSPDGALAGESTNEGTEDDTVVLEGAAPGSYAIYVNSPRGLASDVPYQLTASAPDLPQQPATEGPETPSPPAPDVPAAQPVPPVAPSTPPLPAAAPAARTPISSDTAARVTSTRLVRGHGAWVQGIALYPDGKRLASAAGDGVVKLWDVATLAEERSIIAANTSAEAVAVSPDGKLMATGTDDGRIRIWDAAATSRVERYLIDPVGGAVRSLAFSPDSRWLAAGSDDARVRLWDVSGERPLRPSRTFTHKMTVRSLAFSPNGKLLVTGSDDGTARVWDTSSNGNEVRGLQATGAVRSVAVSSDGRYVAAGGDRTVTIWQLESGREVQRVEPGTTTHAVAFAPGGQVLATSGADRTIRLWETESGRDLKRLTGHGDTVQSLAFTADGRVLISAGKDGAIGTWGVE
ncbi:MAG: High-affnity carbon uptake protein Hat/HatR [uncultured Chloroflexi bacterium]|uniref:High-affnity carbon uptake protein Hat/HatR n=1 Tax=uncultured Chloroflexota bacterium TaxID=166587 RepID=A0A6J4I711_9CHLR|nr:MAG: High-affnity carbon uptake protein Hat/HatR [uncultured Chloroflexota bacterium]